LPDWLPRPAPPITEEQIEQLKNDPRVVYWEHPDLNPQWTFEPWVALDEPVDVL
jgi:hypothetical protein